MQRLIVKPSRPAAILTLVVGVGVLVFGLANAQKFTPFLIFWAIALVAIVGFNLWSAFSPNGSTYKVQGQNAANPGRRSGTLN